MSNNKEEVNNNALLVVFIIVLSIFIGGICFIAGMIYSSYLNKEEKIICETKNKEEKEYDSSKETEVTNEIIIKEITKKKDILINYSESDNNYNLFKTSTKKDDINNTEKLKIALFISESSKENNNFFITKEEVTNNYYDFFGITPKTLETIKLNNEEYIYNKEEEKYTFKNNNIKKINKYYTYDYTYTEDENNYYLYTALASSNEEKIYLDVDNSITYDNKETEFELDSSNYEEFSKYKITLNKKSKYQLFFSSIERIQ